MNKKKILFLTGTRADYGKLEPLMKALDREPGFEVHIFVTGMHMLLKYGNTRLEAEKYGFKNVYYYLNQRSNDPMDMVLSNTVAGVSNYLHLLKPDLVVVHGDRVEALGGAIAGAFNNFPVAHIEGGEVSGTIDESIRHAVSKMAHLHFVANEDAKRRLARMGESEDTIFVVGSPDIDLMLSPGLPALTKVKEYYEIPYQRYGILIYHPVTTDLHNLWKNFRSLLTAVERSEKNYVIIYPNNDPGSDIIIEELELCRKNPRFRIFPSIRFESFLVLLKNCEFVIGNSSVGIREAPIYAVPAINVGDRQKNRFFHDTILNTAEDEQAIGEAISRVSSVRRVPSTYFGDGKSVERFVAVLKDERLWGIKLQKVFVDSW